MHVDGKTAIGVILQAAFGVAGHLVLGYAMRRMPPFEDLSLGEVGRFYRYIGTTPVVWLGIALLAVSFSMLLGLLSRAPASVIVPAGATSYVVTALLAALLLREAVPPLRWVGVALIALGVGIVLSSQPRFREGSSRGPRAESPAAAASENPPGRPRREGL